MQRIGLFLGASAGLAVLLCGAFPASAQVAQAPSLGTASPYTVLGLNPIPTVGTVTCTNTGPGSTIDGDVGTTFTSITNTACTITGAIDAPVAGSVVTDFNAAFAAIDAQNPVCTGVIPTVTTTLAPGVYCSDAGTTLGAGVILTLSGTATDVWVFRVGTAGPGALTLTNAQVVMDGTAQACNVYWKTSAEATATDSTFSGTVLSGAATTMTRGSWFGRALATTDATVTDAAPLTFAGCPPPLPPTVTKAFAPTSIAEGGVSRLTVTLNNANASAISLVAAFTDTLPGGVLVAPTPNTATTCGGAATATAGGSTVTLAAGSTIPAGSCTLAVDVTAAAAGTFVNTIPAGALQTNTGHNADPANATLTVTTCPVITLSPETLPNGTVGVAYSQTITASGGTAPHTFTVSSGALPDGLTLTSAGVLSGTPTAAGHFTFTIRGTDAEGCFGERSYTIVIAAAPAPPPTCPPITLSPETLPNGTVGVAYSQTITASGGTAPYTFGVTAGTLPAGLTLTSAGVLSGTPTAAGDFTFTIRGTDAEGCFGERSYTIVIAAAPAPPPTCPPITLSPETLPNGTVGVAYSQTITASGGTAPYTFGVTAGTLPAGLTLTSAGVLSGTPTAAGDFTFTIRGTDAEGCFGERSYTLSVLTAVPTLPQVFVLLLALGLTAAGYFRLRQRARAA